MKVSGVPISSFSAVTKLEDEDLFLVTVPTDQNCKFYDNRKTSYESFSNQVFDQMSSKYQLGTMAWEVSSDYSKKNHNHDSLYDKTVVTRKLQDGKPVATFLDITNNGDTGGYDLYSPYSNMPPILGNSGTQIKNQVTVTIPSYTVYKADQPYPGEIKMVAERRQKTININSPDFDGWVYADGSTYSKASFPYSASVFPTASDSTKFVVPILSDFIKIASSTESVSPHVEGTEVIGSHNHGAALIFRDSVYSGVISAQGTSDWSSGQGGHNSKTAESEYKCSLTLSIDTISFQSQTTTNPTGPDPTGPTHPTYNSIPTMIYIGKKAR